MSPAEWAQLRRSYSAAWFFIRDAVDNSLPAGRIFGSKPADGENLAKPQGFCVDEKFRHRIAELEERIRTIEEDEESVATHNLMTRLEELEGDNADLKRWKEVALASFEGISARLERLEHRDNGEPFNDWLDRQFEKLGMALRGYERRIGYLERIGDEFQNDISKRFRTIENSLTSYGVPIVGEIPLPPTQLDEAVARVKDYMEHMDFDEDTIGGVVRMVRGETYGGRLRLGHLFRFNAPDRRHCSYRPNHRGNPCGKLASEH